MSICSRLCVGVVALCMVGAASGAGAQTFNVQKYDIKGDGGTDYVTVDAATGRVFVSRATHMMVVDGKTGKVLGDIPDTPGVHGAGIAPKAGHGFTTNGGDQTVTMFDLTTLNVIKKIKVGPGLDGIMYDEPDDKIILTNHSRPIGTLTAIDPQSGDIVATVELEDTAPEGAAADGKGHIFVNNESKHTIQVIDVKTWKPTASWPLAPCEGPTGIAYDKATNRIFSGCSKTSVVARRRYGHDRRHDCERDSCGRARLGSRQEIDLHPEWWRRQRHGRPPGLRRQVQRRGHGADVRGGEDDRRGSEDAQRVSLPARARSSTAAAARFGAASGGAWWTWTRSTGTDRRGVVHRDHAVGAG